MSSDNRTLYTGTRQFRLIPFQVVNPKALRDCHTTIRIYRGPSTNLASWTRNHVYDDGEADDNILHRYTIWPNNNHVGIALVATDKANFHLVWENDGSSLTRIEIEVDSSGYTIEPPADLLLSNAGLAQLNSFKMAMDAARQYLAEGNRIGDQNRLVILYERLKRRDRDDSGASQ